MIRTASSIAWISFLLLVVSPLQSATVRFDPPAASVQPGEAAEFQVWIDDTDLSEFDTVDVLVGSNEGLSFDFRINSLLDCASLDCGTGQPKSRGVYSSDLIFGAIDFWPPAFQSPLLLGTLVVGSLELEPGEYEFIVSSSTEIARTGAPISLITWSGEIEEVLEGRGTLVVVPELSSVMILFLLAGSVAARSRRVSRRAVS